MQQKGNKKASGFFDVIYVFIFLFFVSIVAFVALFAGNEVKDALVDQPQEVIPENAKELLTTYNDRVDIVLDGGIVIWFFILYLGVLISSIFLDNSPVFFVLFIMLSLVSFFIFPIFTNMLDSFTETAFNTSISKLPMTFFLINNIVFVILFFVISVGVGLYAKSRLTA